MTHDETTDGAAGVLARLERATNAHDRERAGGLLCAGLPE